MTYGGPAVPAWLDDVLEEVVGAAAPTGGRRHDAAPPASSTRTCTSGTRREPTGTPTCRIRPKGVAEGSGMYRRFDVAHLSGRVGQLERREDRQCRRRHRAPTPSTRRSSSTPRPAERGGPDAIVGGLPPADSTAEAIAFIDRQMSAPRFRGVRPMGGLATAVPDPDVLRALAERNLVFDLMTHPDQLRSSAEELAHSPTSPSSWSTPGGPATTPTRNGRSGGRASTRSPGSAPTSCASSRAWPCRSRRSRVGDLRPWLEYAIGAFGADRCMFASNFPVDSDGRQFRRPLRRVRLVTSGLDDASRDALFAGTAERVYRL